jgi:putative transposase
MKYKLGRSAHSVYSLHYHLVVVIKYRRKALYDEVIRERLKQIIWSLTDQLGIEILAQEPAEDHLHILFTATLSLAVPKCTILAV